MKVALRAPNGLYVTAEEGGGIDTRDPATPVALRARGTQVDAWQVFTVEQHGDHVALKTSDDYYWTAENGGGGAIRTNGKELGPWEQFAWLDDGVLATWDGLHVVGLAPGDDPIVDAVATLPTLTVEVIEADGPAPWPPGKWRTVNDGPIAASYCSHKDHEGQVCFDPIYFGNYWDQQRWDEIDACLTLKRSLGLTDIVIAVQGGYGDYMGGQTFDFRNDPSRLHALAAYVLDHGFRPIIYVCTADGGTEKEIYNGVMDSVCRALVDLVPYAWFSIGWEVDKDRGGAFTAGQASDALLCCRRALGDAAQLIWHGQPNRTTPASYYGSDYNHKPSTSTPIRWVGDAAKNDGAWVDEDDPSDGNEQGAFFVEGSGFAEIDIVFFQTDHGNEGPSYVSGNPGLDQFNQPRWWGRTLECLDRFLEAGTPMPGAQGYQRVDDQGVLHIHPGVAGSRDSAGYTPPDWFHSYRRRGRPKWVLFETVPYEYMRDQCSEEAVTRCTNEGTSFGAVHQGCLGGVTN